jgi:hypothetical protein
MCAARMEGDLAPGTSFEWKVGPGTIRSTLREVDRPRVLGWTGKTMGIPAIHVYRLEENNGQRKLYLKSHEMAFLCAFFASRSRKRWIRRLKADCEP